MAHLTGSASSGGSELGTSGMAPAERPFASRARVLAGGANARTPATPRARARVRAARHRGRPGTRRSRADCPLEIFPVRDALAEGTRACETTHGVVYEFQSGFCYGENLLFVGVARHPVTALVAAMTAGRDGRGQSSAINPPGMIPPSHHENDEPVSLGAEPGSPVTESFGPELNSPAGDYRHGADEGEAEASGIEEEKDEGKPPSGIGALGVTYAVSGGGTECRICLMDDGAMCSPCDCSGSTQFVHLDCLARWCRETGAVTFELCNGALPSHFIDAGKTVRRARAAQEAERREAAERLERLTSNS